MDPLSIASSVAGLATLADVVISRLYNTIIACKRASEVSRRLLREVQALHGILQGVVTLEGKLGAAALQSHIPSQQVSSCQTTLENMCDKLSKADPKGGVSLLERAKLTIKWPITSSETDQYLAEIERHKSTFDLALSVNGLDAIISSHQTGEKTLFKIDKAVNILERLWIVEKTKESLELLRKLGAEDTDKAYHDNLRLHQDGTGL